MMLLRHSNWLVCWHLVKQALNVLSLMMSPLAQRFPNSLLSLLVVHSQLVAQMLLLVTIPSPLQLSLHKEKLYRVPRWPYPLLLKPSKVVVKPSKRLSRIPLLPELLIHLYVHRLVLELLEASPQRLVLILQVELHDNGQPEWILSMVVYQLKEELLDNAQVKSLTPPLQMVLTPHPVLELKVNSVQVVLPTQSLQLVLMVLLLMLVQTVPETMTVKLRETSISHSNTMISTMDGMRKTNSRFEKLVCKEIIQTI